MKKTNTRPWLKVTRKRIAVLTSIFLTVIVIGAIIIAHNSRQPISTPTVKDIKSKSNLNDTSTQLKEQEDRFNKDLANDEAELDNSVE